jgi:hypothetical protein
MMLSREAAPMYVLSKVLNESKESASGLACRSKVTAEW